MRRTAAYRSLLTAALDHGHRVLGVERWLDERPEGPCLVVRHDVDQQPGAALRMLAVECELGVTTSWYFRWRTATPRVVSAVRASGAEVGLHYETLTRIARALGRPPDGRMAAAARDELAREVAAFVDRHGPIRSICPHGDSRVPGVHNGTLVDPSTLDADLGVRWDANESLRGVPLAAWVTDRPGGLTWKDELDPLALLAAGATPMLLVVHPHHWASRVDAALDRVTRIAGPPDEPPL